MARTHHNLGATAEANIKARMARGESARQIHAALVAAGVKGASPRTVTRRMNAYRPEVNAAIAARSRTRRAIPATSSPGGDLPAEPAPEPPPDTEASAKDRQVDELLAKSLTWRRVQSALSVALSAHPAAAAAVVRALRGISL